MVSILALSIALTCILQAAWFKRDFFSPLNIFVFTQSTTFGVAYLKFAPQMTDFKAHTWWVYLSASVSFIMGCLLVYLISYNMPWFKNFKLSPWFKEHQEYDPAVYNWHLHFIFSLVAWVIYMSGILAAYLKAGTLILFSGKIGSYMGQDWNIGYFTFPMHSVGLCVLLFGVASFKSLNPYVSIRIWSRLFVVLSIAAIVIMYPNRTNIMIATGFLIILFNYSTRRIPVRLIAFLFASAIALFILIGELKDQYASSGGVEKMKVEVLNLPYMYIANNYWNLDYALNPPSDREIHPFTWGVDALDGALEFGLTPQFQSAYHWDNLFNGRIQKKTGLNTISYVWQAYKDWSYFGVVFFPFLVGMALTWLYLKLRRSPSIPKLLFHTFLIYLLGWWWFIEGYKQGLFWLWAYFLILTTLFCSKRIARHRVAQATES
jgi:oligosaccharide repeat unit polymerase